MCGEGMDRCVGKGWIDVVVCTVGLDLTNGQ